MKIRDFHHTSREGSRRCSALHGTHSACATGTADRSPPVPIEDPVQKSCTAEECCVHSFCAGASVHDTDVAMMEDEHDIALFVLAELAWYHRQACE